MARNTYHTLGAADDGLDLDENESTEALDMSNAEKATVTIAGTFGGGTATIEITCDGTNWVSSGQTATAAASKEITMPCKALRVTLAGATAPDLVVAAARRLFD